MKKIVSKKNQKNFRKKNQKKFSKKKNKYIGGADSFNSVVDNPNLDELRRKHYSYDSLPQMVKDLIKSLKFSPPYYGKRPSFALEELTLNQPEIINHSEPENITIQEIKITEVKPPEKQKKKRFYDSYIKYYFIYL